MACIVAGIHSLLQHINAIEVGDPAYDLSTCGHCGRNGLWRHGTRYRKADRELDQKTQSLNPVPIPRRYCPGCKHTCSLLPECLPPFRWYLWRIQEAALKLFILGININKISQKIIPSRWTIRRWINRFTTQFKIHASYLQSQWSWLGYKSTFGEFWTAWFSEKKLSTAMYFIHAAAVVIP